jgi:hypothetical protein
MKAYVAALFDLPCELSEPRWLMPAQASSGIPEPITPFNGRDLATVSSHSAAWQPACRIQ